MVQLQEGRAARKGSRRCAAREEHAPRAEPHARKTAEALLYAAMHACSQLLCTKLSAESTSLPRCRASLRNAMRLRQGVVLHEGSRRRHARRLQVCRRALACKKRSAVYIRMVRTAMLPRRAATALTPLWQAPSTVNQSGGNVVCPVVVTKRVQKPW